MRESIELIAVGSPVEIGIDDKIKAIVTAISIHNKGRVLYQCAWWNGLTHESIWLEELEVRAVAETRSVRIGFGAAQ